VCGADFSQHLVVGTVGDVDEANVVVLAVEAAGDRLVDPLEPGAPWADRPMTAGCRAACST
jgi:hypothetical protein